MTVFSLYTHTHTQNSTAFLHPFPPSFWWVVLFDLLEPICLKCARGRRRLRRPVPSASSFVYVGELSSALVGAGRRWSAQPYTVRCRSPPPNTTAVFLFILALIVSARNDALIGSFLFVVRSMFLFLPGSRVVESKLKDSSLDLAWNTFTAFG